MASTVPESQSPNDPGAETLANAFSDGSDTIKDLLQDEASIKIECRSCQTVYPSVAEFITHKRQGCQVSSLKPLASEQSPQATVTANTATLKWNLIRDLMHTLGRNKLACTMVQVALSGKEAFSVFELVVKKHFRCKAHHDDFKLSYMSPSLLEAYEDVPYLPTKDYIDVGDHGIQLMFARCVQRLIICADKNENSPNVHFTGDITELSLDGNAPLDFIPPGKSWVKVLRILGYPLETLDKIVYREYEFDRLKYLEVKMGLWHFCKLITMKPRFPFPETVVLDMGGYMVNDEEVLFRLKRVDAFRNVKNLRIQYRSEDLERGSRTFHDMFDHFPAILQWFPNVKMVKFDVSGVFLAWSRELEPSELLNFHEKLLSELKFPVPVEIFCVDYARYDQDHPEQVTPYVEKVKAAGFRDRDFTVEKQSENVKLVHCIWYDGIEFSPPRGDFF
uniref:C2H2-type domain-containing protein n=1 Tax=Panagrellus redivivus TaxID=6233 RepID=A0A7E4W6E4_PANRE